MVPYCWFCCCYGCCCSEELGDKIGWCVQPQPSWTGPHLQNPRKRKRGHRIGFQYPNHHRRCLVSDCVSCRSFAAVAAAVVDVVGLPCWLARPPHRHPTGPPRPHLLLSVVYFHFLGHASYGVWIGLRQVTGGRREHPGWIQVHASWVVPVRRRHLLPAENPRHPIVVGVAVPAGGAERYAGRNRRDSGRVPAPGKMAQPADSWNLLVGTDQARERVEFRPIKPSYRFDKARYQLKHSTGDLFPSVARPGTACILVSGALKSTG